MSLFAFGGGSTTCSLKRIRFLTSKADSSLVFIIPHKSIILLNMTHQWGWMLAWWPAFICYSKKVVSRLRQMSFYVQLEFSMCKGIPLVIWFRSPIQKQTNKKKHWFGFVEIHRGIQVWILCEMIFVCLLL